MLKQVLITAASIIIIFILYSAIIYMIKLCVRNIRGKKRSEYSVEKAESLIQEGIDLSNKNNFEAALKKYDEVLKYSDFDEEFYVQRCIILQELGRHKSSLKDFDKVLKQNNNNTYALIRKAVSLIKTKKLNKVPLVMNRVLALEPDSQNAIYVNVMFYAAKVEYKNALSLLESLSEESRNQFNAHKDINQIKSFINLK